MGEGRECSKSWGRLWWVRATGYTGRTVTPHMMATRLRAPQLSHSFEWRVLLSLFVFGDFALQIACGAAGCASLAGETPGGPRSRPSPR
jgi:hypothetical protein